MASTTAAASAFRHRITELAAHPIRRATSFSGNLCWRTFSARLRRSESSSAEPFGRIMTSFRQEIHPCIILCEVNRRTADGNAGERYLRFAPKSSPLAGSRSGEAPRSDGEC